MLNFFKNKEVTRFVELTLSASNHDKMVRELINHEEAEKLSWHFDLVSRCYVATYIYHVIKTLGNSNKSDEIKKELEKKIENKTFSLHEEIFNHFPNEDFAFLGNSGSWLINKLNLHGTLKAMAIAHQYAIMKGVLNYEILWNSITAPIYASAEIMGYFANRSHDKKFALKVILFSMLSEVEDIHAFEKYINIENNNTKHIIKNLEAMTNEDGISDVKLLRETLVRCDPLHHYARGEEYPLNIFGESLQRNCNLASDLIQFV